MRLDVRHERIWSSSGSRCKVQDVVLIQRIGAVDCAFLPRARRAAWLPRQKHLQTRLAVRVLVQYSTSVRGRTGGAGRSVCAHTRTGLVLDSYLYCTRLLTSTYCSVVTWIAVGNRRGPSLRQPFHSFSYQISGVITARCDSCRGSSSLTRVLP